MGHFRTYQSGFKSHKSTYIQRRKSHRPWSSSVEPLENKDASPIVQPTSLEKAGNLLNRTIAPGSNQQPESVNHQSAYPSPTIQAKALPTEQNLLSRKSQAEPSLIQRDDDPVIEHLGAQPMPFAAQDAMRNPNQDGTQALVPSAKDLMELKNYLDYDHELFRPEWAKLTESQAWALLAAEKKGEIQKPADTTRAITRLKDLNQFKNVTYPTGDEQLEAILERVAEHISSRPIASNFNLTAPPAANRMTNEELASAPKTLAELLMEDKDHLFRTVWETKKSQASDEMHVRAGIEERMGYGAAVGRKSGKYQDQMDKDSTFEPDDPSEMPKYAALVSENQKAGVAPRYGASIIYWKDKLRSRVTHTPGDSWGTNGAHFFTSNKHPMPLIAHGDINLVRLMVAEATNFRFDPNMRRSAERGMQGFDAYFETQIHGNLSWADIDRIVLNWGVFKNQQGTNLPTSKAHSQALKVKLEQFASENGYDFTVQMGQELEQQDNSNASI